MVNIIYKRKRKLMQDSIKNTEAKIQKVTRQTIVSVKSLTSDNIWPEHVLISGGNPHPTSRFCRVELGLTTLFNMVSRASFKIRWATFHGFRYRATHHLFPRSSCLVLGVRGCVKSPTSDNIWPEHVLISGGNPHPTSRFCRVELGLTTLLNKSLAVVIVKRIE